MPKSKFRQREITFGIFNVQSKKVVQFVPKNGILPTVYLVQHTKTNETLTQDQLKVVGWERPSKRIW